MKDSPFLSGVLSDGDIAALLAIAKAPQASFAETVRLGGLDPTRALRFADLRGVNFSNSDMRGFDFSGADLRDAVGIEFKIDRSTIFDGADLAGSVFAAKARLARLFANDEQARKLMTSVTGLSINEQAAWAAQNLQSKSRYRHLAVPILEALFYRTDDGFLKLSLLGYVAPRLGSKAELKEMLFAALADQPDTASLVRSSFSLFRRNGMAHDSSVRTIASALMDSDHPRVREMAVDFLMSTNPTDTEVRALRGKAQTDTYHYGVMYVSAVAKKLGDEFDLVTRDPLTNATLHIYGKVSPKMRDLIARRWLKAESSREEQGVSLHLRRKGINPASRGVITARAEKVEAMWSRLRDFGVDFLWSSDPAERDYTFEFDRELG